MLSCLLKEGNGIVSVTGTFPEIMCDITTIIRSIYDDFNDKGMGVEAEVFKEFCCDLLPKVSFAKECDLDDVIEKVINSKKDAKKDSENKNKSGVNTDDMIKETRKRLKSLNDAIKEFEDE